MGCAAISGMVERKAQPCRADGVRMQSWRPTGIGWRDWLAQARPAIHGLDVNLTHPRRVCENLNDVVMDGCPTPRPTERLNSRRNYPTCKPRNRSNQRRTRVCANVPDHRPGASDAREERVVPVSELRKADEAFLTNALVEVLPITRLGPRCLGRIGPLTRELQSAYRRKVEAECRPAKLGTGDVRS
jgi:hypothetical protein